MYYTVSYTHLTENRNKVNILSEYKIKIPDFDSQESGIFVGKILKLKAVESKITVSYTHLDVYKRQTFHTNRYCYLKWRYIIGWLTAPFVAEFTLLQLYQVPVSYTHLCHKKNGYLIPRLNYQFPHLGTH